MAPAPINVISCSYTPEDEHITPKFSGNNIRKRLFPPSENDENVTRISNLMPLDNFTYQPSMIARTNHDTPYQENISVISEVSPLEPSISSVGDSLTLKEMFYEDRENVMVVSQDAPQEVETIVQEDSQVIVTDEPPPEATNEIDVLSPQQNIEKGKSVKKRTRNVTANNDSPTRKRLKNSTGNTVAQAKLAYNCGLSHVTSKGKERKEREVKEGCSANCRKKCQERITLERRQKLFKLYYSSGSKQGQWHMLVKLAKQVPIKRRTVPVISSPRRKGTFDYYLTDDAGTIIPVCQPMFLATFDISKTVVQNAHRKNSPDKRGKQTINRPSRIPQNLKENVKNHIKSFPKIESHYCRESSKRQYLQENLSVSKMYRMYLAARSKNEPETATLRQYRDILNFCFNLSFYQLKKDQCSLCAKWKDLPQNEKEGNSDIVKDYTEHNTAKELARTMKQDSKNLSRSEGNKDGKIKIICFDLQKVFFCPKSEVGDFFYKKKLACYDFTIFDCTQSKATCYVWDQTTGGRGGVEISSCVYKYIEQEASNGVKEFHIYSDSCWAQNKNQIIFTMYYVACHKFGIKIIHRYLQKGHTQMECDSVHASIEKKIKNVDIFTPKEWYGYIRTAKVNKPHYIVVQVKQDDFVSFKDLAHGHFNWQKVQVSKLNEITLDFKTPATISFKKKLSDQETRHEVLLKKPGQPIVWGSFKPPRVYLGPLALKPMLVKDLEWMLKQKLIPDRAVEFYQTITSPIFGTAVTPEGQEPDEDDIPTVVDHDTGALDSLLEANNDGDNIDDPESDV